jgi:hypothetical protein
MIQSHILVRIQGNLTATVWGDKGDVYILNRMHIPPAESNSCNEHMNALKPEINRKV